LIAENRFNSKDPSVRNTLLSLASIFGTRNITNALDLLDSASTNSYKQHRWKKYGSDNNFQENDTVVTEYVACVSERTLIQVRGSSGRSHYILPRSNRCSCEAWHQNVWKSSENSSKSDNSRRNKLESKSYLTCKHVLAAELAKSIHKNSSMQNDRKHDHSFASFSKMDSKENRFQSIFKRITKSEDEYTQMIVEMD